MIETHSTEPKVSKTQMIENINDRINQNIESRYTENTKDRITDIIEKCPTEKHYATRLQFQKAKGSFRGSKELTESEPSHINTELEP